MRKILHFYTRIEKCMYETWKWICFINFYDVQVLVRRRTPSSENKYHYQPKSQIKSKISSYNRDRVKFSTTETFFGSF